MDVNLGWFAARKRPQGGRTVKNDSSPPRPTPAFTRLAKAFELVKKRGWSDERLTAFVETYVKQDLALEEAKRRRPSIN
jgi:hypothetical protein